MYFSHVAGATLRKTRCRTRGSKKQIRQHTDQEQKFWMLESWWSRRAAGGVPPPVIPAGAATCAFAGAKYAPKWFNELQVSWVRRHGLSPSGSTRVVWAEGISASSLLTVSDVPLLQF